jgi:hypothetical protein
VDSEYPGLTDQERSEVIVLAGMVFAILYLITLGLFEVLNMLGV